MKTLDKRNHGSSCKPRRTAKKLLRELETAITECDHRGMIKCGLGDGYAMKALADSLANARVYLLESK